MASNTKMQETNLLQIQFYSLDFQSFLNSPNVQCTLSYIVEGGVGNEMDAHQGEELLGKKR